MKSPRWLPGILLLALAGWLIHLTWREGPDHHDSNHGQTHQTSPTTHSLGKPTAFQSLKTGHSASGISRAVQPSFSSLQSERAIVNPSLSPHPANQGSSPFRASNVAGNDKPQSTASGFRANHATRLANDLGGDFLPHVQLPPTSQKSISQPSERAGGSDSGSSPKRMPQTHEFPAVWADLGRQSGISPPDLAHIDEAADALKTAIEGSIHSPSSQEYSELWNQSVRQSDRWFRLRFGSRTWMRHHIASHHLASPQNLIPE